MRTLMIAVILVAGCGKTSTPTPESTGSGSGTTAAAGSGSSGDTELFAKAITDLGDLKTKMCACKDSRCTSLLMDDYRKWRMDMKRTTVGKRPNKEQDERGKTLDKELRTCRTTVEASVAGGSGSGSAGSGSASGDPFDQAIVELEGWKVKMCACTNKACADLVQADLGTWQRLLRTRITAKPNKVQEIRGNAIDKDIKDCRKKAEAGTPGAPGGGDKIDQMIVKMVAFRERTCACKDRACAEAVGKEIQTWQLALAKDLADAKPTKDQDEKFDKVDTEIRACKAKL
ncbi:MAG: hypothetical protein ABI867_08360 [Kofleriaceae bacterium]